MRRSLEVRVLQRLSSGYSLLRVEDHHLVHEIYGLGRGVGDQLLEGGGHKLRKIETELCC